MEAEQFRLCPPPFADRYANAAWSARHTRYTLTYKFEAPSRKPVVQFPSSLPYDGQPLPASTAENWDRLAAADAMWTVLSDSSKFGGKWNAEDFFATGATIVERISAFEERGFHIPRGVAIDFGCGLGRVSRWLAKCFSHVVGVDISPKMLELAKTYNRATAVDHLCAGQRIEHSTRNVVGRFRLQRDRIAAHFAAPAGALSA